MNYEIYFSKQAQKDLELIKQRGLLSKVDILLKILGKNPFQNPPPYEKLTGNLNGFYSRRINVQHRLVYMVESTKIKIVRLWTHYEDIR